VSEELELEDLKDLRAEVRKFLISTNERKNMSTKTNFKRIALVAVAALGAGVLSVAPANAANIAIDEIIVKTAAVGFNQGNAVCSIGTTSSVQSATVPVGSVGVTLTTVAAAAGDNAYISVSGPGIIASTGANWNVNTQTTATTVAGHLTGTDAAADRVVIKPTGTGVITVAVKASASASTTDTVTLTVVAACVSNTYSSTRSYSTIISLADAKDDTWASTSVDDATVGTTLVYGDSAYIAIQLNDAYGVALATSGAVVVSATGDVVVGVAERANSSDSTLPSFSGGISKTAVLASTGADILVQVAQDSGAATTSVVTITKDGVVVGTKSFVFQGIPATVTISDVTVGARSSGYGYFRATVRDSAGNPLAAKDIVTDSVYNAAALSVVSGVTGAQTAAVTGKTPGIAADGSTTNVAKFQCTALGGTAKLQVRVVANAATDTYVSSAPFDVLCGGAAVDTWSISMDKATYSPGEIATLTVSAKDTKGLAVESLLAIGTVVAGFGGMEFVTAPTSTDVFASAAGAKTYQLKVGTTEGAFVGTFKITGSTDSAAKTVQYKIANAAGTVSNADVLKAIVSLIASINKQIAALQKALLRR
jgi:trimeric autotransporter adhesin